MKNVLQLLTVLCLFMLGCKQQELAEPEKLAGYEATFAVSDLFTDVEPFRKEGAVTSAIGDTLRNYARYLYCRIYPESNPQNYISLEQTADSPTFGVLKTMLPSGNYSVSFLASNQKLNIDQTNTAFSDFQMRRTEQGYWEDVFALYNHKVVVAEGNISSSVRLQRMVGAIEVNVQDAIPATVTKIALDLSNDASGYHFGNQSYVATTSRKEFSVANQAGQTNRKFLIHVLNTAPAANLGVTIKAYNSSNAVLHERKVTVQQVYANKKTVLTGTLFNPLPTDVGFTVTIDPKWGTGTPVRVEF